MLKIRIFAKKACKGTQNFRDSATSLCLFNIKMSLTLTHLVLGVLLVDNEQASLAAYDLAVGGALLQ
jgi:hypothetical protein